MLLASQVVPNGFTAFLCYVCLGGFLAQFIGNVFNEWGGWLRFLGLSTSFGSGFLLMWIMICNDYCPMFYFAKFFSPDFNN